MGTCDNQLSNFERKKKALIYGNLWKSNFIKLWETYGTFKTVDGIKCFDGYRIDGNGEGQVRMSRHLKQPDLCKETMNDDLEWVRLVFSLDKLARLSPEIIAAWIAAMKEEILTYGFDHLNYTIVSGRVAEHYFSLNGVALLEDTFLHDVSLWVAELALYNAKIGLLESQYDTINITYDSAVTPSDIAPMMDDIGALSSDYISQGFFGNYGYDFRLPFIEKYIQAWSVQQKLGADILDDLVQGGFLIGTGTEFGYELPVESVRKMNPFVFFKLLSSTLDFDYKEEGSFLENLFKNLLGLILGVFALLIGQVEIAIALFTGFFLSKIGNPIIKAVATVIVMFLTGGLDISSFGISEAVNLLMNVYSIYIELKMPMPEKEHEESVENEQYMFYKAPYSAYNDIYCYKDLISVSLDQNY